MVSHPGKFACPCLPASLSIHSHSQVVLTQIVRISTAFHTLARESILNILGSSPSRRIAILTLPSAFCESCLISVNLNCKMGVTGSIHGVMVRIKRK